MPYVGELTHGGTGLLWIGHGVVTGQELIDAGETELSLTPHPEKITHSLVDFTQTTSIQVTTDEVLKVGEIDRRNATKLRGLFVAVVVPNSVGQYLASVYENLSAPQGWTVEIFQTREAAEAWLSTVVSVKS